MTAPPLTRVPASLKGGPQPQGGAGWARRGRRRKSPGRFGRGQLLGLLLVAGVLASPLARRLPADVGRAAEAVRVEAAPAHPSAESRPALPVAPPLDAPSVEAWADRVGVPVASANPAAPVSSPFGRRVHPVLGGVRHHAGVDLAAPAGSPVLATATGVVVAAGPLGAYGLRVDLHHPASGLTTRYAHLAGFRPGLRVGARVRRGALVGYVGASGLVTGPHLHYEVRDPGGAPLDPAGLARRYRTSYDRAARAYREALAARSGGGGGELE